MKYMLRTLALASACVAVLNAAPRGQQIPGDNTKVNRTEAPTAQQHANNQADLETSRQIRKALVGDKSLSTYAHNVKIITRNGQVTLKGPVRTPEEKASIEAKATEIAGSGNVVDQISVVPSKTSQK
jgi:hyperosmotically inducible periplasmic protein